MHGCEVPCTVGSCGGNGIVSTANGLSVSGACQFNHQKQQPNSPSRTTSLPKTTTIAVPPLPLTSNMSKICLHSDKPSHIHHRKFLIAGTGRALFPNKANTCAHSKATCVYLLSQCSNDGLPFSCSCTWVCQTRPPCPSLHRGRLQSSWRGHHHQEGCSGSHTNSTLV